MVEGYGLKEVMGTSGVDGLKCKSNHVLEMLGTLGIEAARLILRNLTLDGQLLTRFFIPCKVMV
jgi:hypothetical protein